MNRSDRPSVSGIRRFVFLCLLALLALGGSDAKADPVTHSFTGVVTGVFGVAGQPDFSPFTSAVTISGAVSFAGGEGDTDPSSSHGYFQNVTLSLELDAPGLGEWLSANNGLVEVWNNQPGVFDEADSISFVGAETDVRIGPSFGDSVFTSIQLTLLDNSPAGTPDMLSSDSLPLSLEGWERGFAYLNYRADLGEDGFMFTTVRLEFMPITAVPEPSAFALIAMGAAVLAWRQRRRSS